MPSDMATGTRGRKRHVRSQEMADSVFKMASDGMPYKSICKRLGIGDGVFRREYLREFHEGQGDLVQSASQSMKILMDQGDYRATEFILAHHAGMRRDGRGDFEADPEVYGEIVRLNYLPLL